MVRRRLKSYGGGTGELLTKLRVGGATLWLAIRNLTKESWRRGDGKYGNKNTLVGPGGVGGKHDYLYSTKKKIP